MAVGPMAHTVTLNLFQILVKWFNPLTPAPAKILAQVCNAVTPPDWARELFKPSSDSASLRLKSKKMILVFGLGFVGDRCKYFFSFFWPHLPGFGPQPIGPLFWLNIFLETRPKSASLKPLNDFLAYWERKLWLINQKLTKILLLQTLLWGALRPRQ